MAPPTRFNSVRGGSRPAVRDANLVGFRYDKAVAAEPPVHITPRQASGGSSSSAASTRPKGLTRSPSSSTTTSTSSYSYAASISVVSLAGTAATSIHGVPASSQGPVIVAPPRLNMPANIAPPTEQHPALRSPASSSFDDWKRDSAAVVTKTIFEEGRLNVASPGDDDDCFVEKRPQQRPTSKDNASGAAAHVEHIIPAATHPAHTSARAHRQTFNTITTTKGPAPAPSRVSANTGPRYSALHSATTSRHSTTIGAVAAAASSRPVLAALDLRIASSSSPSYSSPSSYIHPARPITASDFLPAPISPPPSPSSRSSPRRRLSKRQNLRFSFWGGSRDADSATTTTASHKQQQQQQHKPAPTAPRRWNSVSQLRGGRAFGGISGNTGQSGGGASLNTSGPAGANAGATGTTPAPAPAKQQPLPEPPVSPAQSSSRSSLAMSSSSPDPEHEGAAAAAEFSPLGITIPTERFLDDDFLASLNFSKRGSLMFDPDTVGAMDRMSLTDDDRSQTPTQPSSVAAAPRPSSSATSHGAVEDEVRVPPRVASPTPDIRVVMTPDVEQESQKVRQLYASGDPSASLRDAASRHSYCDRLEPTPEVLTEDDESVPNGKSSLAPASSVPRSASSSSQCNHNDPATHKELADPAGGFEDWDDLDSALVDRYGFIGTPRTRSRVGTPTEMRSIQYSPRRRNVLTKRDPMGFTSSQSGMRFPSRKVSARSLNTQHSEVSIVSFRSSRSVIRQAGNLLPQNRNRRWMDEAGDMLTVSPNLQDSVEEARIEKISQALKRKEIERSEKWRRMARVIRKGEQGQGMEFDFDTKNPKLIDRTWKGIPDRWRAAAWWSFLATSAKEHPGSASADDIISAFRKLQDRASADDTQIDLDVPRTISRHIMFRRRYRGGQRLLFRVLHALSLYFPDTGYVQGMASLAATLLCYFDEEKCFVMLVRMWTLRGLERLYQPGFEGLMAALREFETTWLNKDVARKMTDLCIDSTAYGTRWYLTLFNLSIPFPAQLRVWDIFLLLGDAATGELPVEAAAANTSAPKVNDNAKLGSTTSPTPLQKEKATGTSKSTTATNKTSATPNSGLDVLHATSAALIQALREVLLDSDFENAMKALTAWIPVKDEDLLMKVTRAEWKTQLKRRS